MSLRTKLTLGLGFLFLIIFALTIYNSYDIQKLSKDADRILEDNYNTLVYCKNMLLALDDMRIAVSSRGLSLSQKIPSEYYSHLFEISRQTFESSLNAEKNNITEVHEKDYVDELSNHYVLYLNLAEKIHKTGGTMYSYANDFLPTYLNVRQTIVEINDINMQAIERKNLSAKQDARNMVTTMAVIGTLCVLLAFFYFWYFPFYVSSTLSYLASKMRKLLTGIDIKVETQTKDEAFVLLQSINLLESKLAKSNGKKEDEA